MFLFCEKLILLENFIFRISQIYHCSLKSFVEVGWYLAYTVATIIHNYISSLYDAEPYPIQHFWYIYSVETIMLYWIVADL